KDGCYAWRPISLIHPLNYVDLVNYITSDGSEFGWENLKDRFKTFQSNGKIKCYSIPIESYEKTITDNGAMILNWWDNIEQESISKSLEYKYCLFTDITDFYPSIYTHSIPWAIHGKNKTKSDIKKSTKWYGGKIDSKIQRMQHNQTNGIPQGSSLMDFISEIILGYIDLKLSEKLEDKNINEYKILRYRDDYRIFSNSKNDIERIVKILHEVLQSFNLKLNSNKSYLSENIILDSIKKDKLYWEPKRATLRNSYLNKKKYDKGAITLQKHLWQIKELADKYPNCGMLKKSLTEFYLERVSNIEENPNDLEILVSILVDIMTKNPNAIKYCVIIITSLYKGANPIYVMQRVKQILKKYSDRPNTEHVEIWLQRLTKSCSISLDYENIFKSPLTKHISKASENQIDTIFPIEWVDNNTHYLSEFKDTTIIDKDKYNRMIKEVVASEIDSLFKDIYCLNI